MLDLDQKIQSEIRDKVFDKCFRTTDPNRFLKGRNILYNYYLKYYITSLDIETKRLILYNLIYSERMLGNEDNVWKYI